MNEVLLKDILSGLLKFLDLPSDGLTVKTEEDGLTRVDILSSNPSRIIGWHGETLNALQHLAKSMLRAKEKLERTPFVVLDVDGYRKI